MSVSPIDYANLALSRITQQYKNKPLYRQLVTELCALTQTGIDDPLEYLFTVYDIDTAEGHNLDVIGIIVGQPRILIDFDILEFFGYVGAAGVGTYGSILDPNLGARYISENESGSGGETTLSDPEYRVFIKARILKNYSVSTPEDIIDSANLIFAVEKTLYIEGDMTFDLHPIGSLNQSDLSLIENYDIIPRPTGVGIGEIIAIPDAITVSGAGTASVNGVYEYFDVSNGYPQFQKTAGDLRSMTYNSGLGKWRIYRISGYYEITSSDIVPPKTGWSSFDAGANPAPTLSY